MKKKLYTYIFTLALSALTFCLSSCGDDFLETLPTTEGDGNALVSDAETAVTALNGIYRKMYTQGWSTTGNPQQCDGMSSWNLMADLMAEDMVMKASGSGWYWYDCIYDVKRRYTSTSWRPYDLWNALYQLITNANNIIANEETMSGTEENVKYAVGQAYAIRALCYNYLASIYARTYIGHENEPCVPVYLEPTTKDTPGKPRETVEYVYKNVIRPDIDKAIELLKDGKKKTDPTHIDYRVANGIKARICLITNEWQEALNAAREAQTGMTPSNAGDLLTGMNNVAAKNVMWGAIILPEQQGGWGPFLYHMDAMSMYEMDPPTGNYAYRAPKCINIQLYDEMGPNDIRRSWWDTDDNPVSNYIQVKFRFSNPATAAGDKIWMRVEEMILIEAEALCRLGNDSEARTILENLIKVRDPEYTANGKTGTELATLTSDKTGSLLEEIILQRRIELWGEVGRIYDIKRLKQGFKRTAEMGWPTDALIPNVLTTDPESYAWVMTIPKAEFDGNNSLNINKDQNPVGDTK